MDSTRTLRCTGRIAIALACAVAILAKTDTAGAASSPASPPKSGETVAPTPPSVQSAPSARASAAASARTAEAGAAADGAKADPLAGADADMRAVVEQLEKLGAKPIATLTPAQARNQPTPVDAARRVLQQRREKSPVPEVRRRNVQYAAATGEQPLRIYTPVDDAATAAPGVDAPRPVILYFHGGGWVIANVQAYDASAAALAEQTGAIVMSAEYRRAPEHKFPAAHEDAIAAYRWVLANAGKYGGDPKKVAVAGESAGGNLAANVAIAARDRSLRMPVALLLVYPVAGTDMDTESYREHANAKPLDKAAMQWFVKTATSPQDAQDPRLNLVAANLKGLPPTTIITAEIDPLRSDGEQLAQKLKAAGVKTTYRNFDGVTHEFFGLAPAVADATAAQDLAAKQLAQALGSRPAASTRAAEAAPR